MILLRLDDLKSFSAKKSSSGILTTGVVTTVVVARSIDFSMSAIR